MRRFLPKTVWMLRSPSKTEQRNHVTKLYVGNLSYGMTDESPLQLFSEKGYKAVSARIITDRETGRSRGFGFVELGPGDDATRAIGEFNGLNVDGRPLMVNEARQESGGGRASRSGGGGRGFSGGRGGRGGGGGRRSY
jgi:RNA recognition motif-containing protein